MILDVTLFVAKTAAILLILPAVLAIALRISNSPRVKKFTQVSLLALGWLLIILGTALIPFVFVTYGISGGSPSVFPLAAATAIRTAPFFVAGILTLYWLRVLKRQLA